MATDSDDAPETAAGAEATAHVPVLRAEAIAALALRPGGLYLDATFGAGGYSRALLDQDVRVLALDRDPEAVADGAGLVARMQGRLTLVPARFGDLDRVAGAHGFAAPGQESSERVFDGVVLDIGVSSMQIDREARGFSFRFDGPLDMRMERAGPTAADIVNTASDEELADIFYHYGEERASRRIARAIVHDRASAPFTTTRALADMIARIMPGRPGDIHPATRVFQALRIAVNDELGELVRALAASARVLKDGGRLVVVSFHSLEDRIVKNYFAACSGRGGPVSRHMPSAGPGAPASFLVPRGQPLVPSPEEARRNPRARSARLRHGVRTAAAALDPPAAVRALAALPARPGRR